MTTSGKQLSLKERMALKDRTATDIEGMRQSLQITGRVLYHRDMVLRFVDSGVLPAWSTKSESFINLGHIEDPLSNEGMATILGLNYHEIAHMIYSPKYLKDLTSKLGALSHKNFENAYVLLEEARVETLYVARYPRVRHWFTYPVVKFLVDDKSCWGTAFLLTHGRKYLPLSIRKMFQDIFSKSYGSSIEQFSSMIDEYRLLSLAKEDGQRRAARIIDRFARLMESVGLNPPDDGLHGQQPQTGGEASTIRKQEQDAATAAEKAEQEAAQDETEEKAQEEPPKPPEAPEDSSEGAEDKPEQDQQNQQEQEQEEGSSEEEDQDTGKEEHPEEEEQDGESGGTGGESEGSSESDEDSDTEGADSEDGGTKADEPGASPEEGNSDRGEDSEGERGGDSGGSDEDATSESGDDPQGGSGGGDSEDQGGDGDQDREQNGSGTGGSGVGSGSSSSEEEGGLTDEQIEEVLSQILASVIENGDAQEEIRNIRSSMGSQTSLSSKLARNKNHRNAPVTAEMFAQSGRVADVLRQIWAQMAPGWDYGVSEGSRLNMSRAALAREPEDYEYIYDDWHDGQQDDAGMEVVILVDESGSMSRNIGGFRTITPSYSDTASKNLWELMYALKEIDAVVTVLTFKNDCLTMYNRDEEVSASEYRVMAPGGGTNPVLAIKEARRILNNSEQPNKLLIVMTDGTWGAAYDWDAEERKSYSYDEILNAMEGVHRMIILIGGLKDFADSSAFHIVARSNGDVLGPMSAVVTYMMQSVAG